MFCSSIFGADLVWPPEKWLLDGLIKGVPKSISVFDAKTGRFGSEPWICTDQNIIFPLAVVWWYKSPDNPYYHDGELLTVIGKGGEALVDEQDEAGRWIFRKKDNSTWGMIHMPWTFSRWIRAYLLVKDALPPVQKAKWEKGLKLGYGHIAKNCATKTGANIATHHAMGLYAAGLAFNNEEWKRIASEFMAAIVKKQSPDGYWTEHNGPVVNYNHVYMEALGAYYAMSRDNTVLEAMRRGSIFHSSILWPDGSSASSIDERNAYSSSKSLGNVGFSWSDEGRGYLLMQLKSYMDNNGAVGMDYLASMLMHGGKGNATLPASASDYGIKWSVDKKMVIARSKPWQVCFSGYASAPYSNRWFMDRQNLVEVYLDGCGLLIGGGNTKMQPYLSTFTFGNPQLLKQDFTKEDPVFVPEIPLKWTHDASRITGDAKNLSMELEYGDNKANVKYAVQEDGSLQLTYSLSGSANGACEAHVPLMKRGSRIRLANGKRLSLGSKSFVENGIGGWLEMGGVRFEVPEVASLRWPVTYFNPYSKLGTGAAHSSSKLVVCLPLTGQKPVLNVIVREAPPELPGAEVYNALDLAVHSPSSTTIKTLKELKSCFMSSTAVGEALVFTVNVKEPGEYEVLADFVTCYTYGIVSLSLDGTVLGKPFDAYTPELDSSGPVSFGKTHISGGEHKLKLTIVGRNPKSSKSFISVKSFFLKKTQ